MKMEDDDDDVQPHIGWSNFSLSNWIACEAHLCNKNLQIAKL